MVLDGDPNGDGNASDAAIVGKMVLDPAPTTRHSAARCGPATATRQPGAEQPAPGANDIIPPAEAQPAQPSPPPGA